MSTQSNNSNIQNSQENSLGFYGSHGGQFVPDEMKARLNEVADCFNKYKNDKNFLAELDDLYKHFCGRPTPIFYCENLSKQLGGADIYLKREDLNHLGAHKLNNALGQLLLAKSQKPEQDSTVSQPPPYPPYTV